MKYNLDQPTEPAVKTSGFRAINTLLRLITHERRNLWLATAAIVVNSGINLLGPYLIGYTVDHYISQKRYEGVLTISAALLGMYGLGLFTSYFQTRLMGGVGQRLLFTLRNAVFTKLQELPVAFFQANKAGDLISRINNDTEKVNTFFSQSLMQFLGSIAMMTGAGIFLLSIHPKLGAASLVPALMILVFTQLLSPWTKKKNALSLASSGKVSSEVQQSLANFRVIIAFNRRDYFRKRFGEVNDYNYRTAIGAGLANGLLLPVYSMFAAIAQLIVVSYGISLISDGDFTIGMLVSYLVYTTSFYNPLRQLAALWTNFQVAMAGWDRISKILALENNLVVQPGKEALPPTTTSTQVSFENVSFGYTADKEILHHIQLSLERGKTYAFVGPTGGGKTTLASLIARLYDPVSGTIRLNGRDLRSYSTAERTQKIGFILQEPFLFGGTVRDNLLYGNDELTALSNEELEKAIADAHLGELLQIFESGLNTPVGSGADNLSLGQKQLIAFMRAVLRRPEILILDEATANIDTLTEQLLENILSNLPRETTLILIAHRLNTIERADEIFFVNAGEVIRAGSLADAMERLMKGKRTS